jgi:hypothetical protein
VFYAAKGGAERLLGGGWIKSATASQWLATDRLQVSASGGPEEAFAAVSQ